MALVHADFIQETSSTTGTGTYTLAGAVAGFQSFAIIGNTNTCVYSASNSAGWEVGIGTYTAAGTLLARTTILASSNANAAVNWAASTTIAVVFPAEVLKQSLYLNSPYTLASQTAAQKLFNSSTNGAVTLPIGTYRFKCYFSLTSLSASSGTFGFALGGTATFTQGWSAISLKDTGLTATLIAPTSTFNTAANTSLFTANTNTVGKVIIEGILRVTVAGTVIPQVSLSVAAAAIVSNLSFFEIERVGNSTESVVGPNWS